MNRINIGYFADGPWAHSALDKLLEDSSIGIAFICARHDNPDPVLKKRAADLRIAFLTHPDINSDEFLSALENYACDIFVSMSFNQIFRKRLIDYPRLNIINCHAGKLPFYRGRNILNWALINDERDFGITVHCVDEGIDTGDILIQRVLPITDADNYSTLLTRAYSGCADVLYEAIKRLQDGTARRIPQSEIHPMGFYCVRRMEGDERMDWRQSSRSIFNFVRAICQPGPQARTFLGDAEIRINKVELLPDAPPFQGIPGAVIGRDAGGFYVKSLDSYVKVVEWSCAARIRIGDRFK